MKVGTRSGFALGIACALLLSSAGCEDDPNDRDFLKQHDAGADASTDASTDASAGDAAITHDDGGASDTGVADSGANGGNDAGGDDAGDAN